MYPQVVIALYGQYLAAMYAASFFNPSSYGLDAFLPQRRPRALPVGETSRRWTKPGAARLRAAPESAIALRRGRATRDCPAGANASPVTLSHASGF